MARAGRKRKSTVEREPNGRPQRIYQTIRYMDGFMDDPTVIYVLEALPYVKVGISNDLSSRVKAIQTGNGQIVRICWYRWMDGSAARKLEKSYHDKFKGTVSHSHGEWYFTTSEEAIARLKQLIRHLGLSYVRGEFSPEIEKVYIPQKAGL